MTMTAELPAAGATQPPSEEPAHRTVFRRTARGRSVTHVTPERRDGKDRKPPRRRARDPYQYAAMMFRWAAAFEDRCLTDGDPEDLAVVRAVAERFAEIEGNLARKLHDLDGLSYGQLADSAGITERGAWNRWVRRPKK